MVHITQQILTILRVKTTLSENGNTLYFCRNMVYIVQQNKFCQTIRATLSESWDHLIRQLEPPPLEGWGQVGAWQNVLLQGFLLFTLYSELRTLDSWLFTLDFWLFTLYSWLLTLKSLLLTFDSSPLALGSWLFTLYSWFLTLGPWLFSSDRGFTRQCFHLYDKVVPIVGQGGSKCLTKWFWLSNTIWAFRQLEPLCRVNRTTLDCNRVVQILRISGSDSPTVHIFQFTQNFIISSLKKKIILQS